MSRDSVRNIFAVIFFSFFLIFLNFLKFIQHAEQLILQGEVVKLQAPSYGIDVPVGAPAASKGNDFLRLAKYILLAAEKRTKFSARCRISVGKLFRKVFIGAVVQ
jgi:uncharacterized protein (DUF1919 family)